MITTQTILNVADNTGAKKVMCIRVLGKSSNIGMIGDCIICVVKEVIPNMLVKRSQIVKGVIIRTKKTIIRSDGMHIRFNENAIVIINNDLNPRGTRIFGPIPYELRNKKFTKIISLAKEII